jgi:hypothetical protein
MKKTFYEKVGRRYVPVSEFDSDLSYALPKGNHLVMVYPGGRSRRYNIDPNYAAMIAAGRIAEDAISDVLRKASDLRPTKTPITEGQRRAWENLVREFGEEARMLEWPSAREACNEAVKAMQAEAEKLMQHEAVRRAYEHFLLTCELCKEHNNGT